MDYNKLAKEAHANAVKHGFWEMQVSMMHCLMLIISEIGERTEVEGVPTMPSTMATVARTSRP